MRTWQKAGIVASMFFAFFSMFDTMAGAKPSELITNISPASIVLFLLIMLDLHMAEEWKKKHLEEKKP